MRHNSFQKIYASYIAPNPDMDVLWMDLKADPYGSVIKFWNGGVGKYELISSDASTIGKHIIYADDVELPVRSSINFKGFEITDDQPSDSMTISVEGKEDAGVAQSIVNSHELEFNHSDIHHENRAALNNVSGTNTGDQDLSGLQSQIDEKADSSTLESYISSIGSELNSKVDKEDGHSLISNTDKTRLSNTSGVNTGDQDLSGLLANSHLSDFNHNDINHTNRYSLDLVSGINTGDQDLSGLVEKINGHSLAPDTEIDKLAEYPEFEDLEFSHENLTDKNSEVAVQHVDTTTTKETLAEADKVALWDSVTGKVVLTPKEKLFDNSITQIPASAGAATYNLTNNKQTIITGTLPNGVNSTLTLPALVAGERNEVILHFKTNAVAAPTLVYSGFTPVWLNGSAISMKVNKQYTIVFEQINGIVKTSWGEY